MSFPFNFHFPGIYIIFGYICYILEFVVRFGTLSLSYILLLYITNEFEQLCYKREKKYVIQTSPDVIQTAALCITVAALCNTDDSVCNTDGRFNVLRLFEFICITEKYCMQGNESVIRWHCVYHVADAPLKPYEAIVSNFMALRSNFCRYDERFRLYYEQFVGSVQTIFANNFFVRICW